jgi:hypothetical protein
MGRAATNVRNRGLRCFCTGLQLSFCAALLFSTFIPVPAIVSTDDKYGAFASRNVIPAASKSTVATTKDMSFGFFKRYL